MHYYKFNIADYRKDTAHLSRLEHGIYRDLIDWYYLEETPIPKKTQTVLRRLRLATEEEKQALENVLEDFFTLEDDGFKHARIEEEIAEYQEKSKTNKANGKKGGRPKKKKPEETEKNPNGFDSDSENKPNANQNESEQNPNHKPLTINHNINNTAKAVCDFPVEKPPDKLPDKPTSKPIQVPIKKIVELYHELLPELPKVQKLTDTRKKQISARWKSGDIGDLDEWREYFEFVRGSRFLMGRSPPSTGHKLFVADLEWLTKESNFVKVWEGKYHGE